jgi:hypothetical protein
MVIVNLWGKRSAHEANYAGCDKSYSDGMMRMGVKTGKNFIRGWGTEHAAETRRRGTSGLVDGKASTTSAASGQNEEERGESRHLALEESSGTGVLASLVEGRTGLEHATRREKF